MCMRFCVCLCFVVCCSAAAAAVILSTCSKYIVNTFQHHHQYERRVSGVSERYNYTQGLYPLCHRNANNENNSTNGYEWIVAKLPLSCSLTRTSVRSSFCAHYLCLRWSVRNEFKIDYTSECLRVDIILDMSLSWCWQWQCHGPDTRTRTPMHMAK